MRLAGDRQGMVAVPNRCLTTMRKDLRIRVFDPQEQTSWTYDSWDDYGKYIGIPRAYAASQGFFGEYALGGIVEPPIERPTMRPKQEWAVGKVIDAFDVHADLILQAPTGEGKTVMGCEIAARLQVPTLILVDQHKLMRQWMDTLTRLFGYGEDEVGIIQGKRVEIANVFTIGMIQSLYNKKFDRDFYEEFGMVIFDECHVCGAEQFGNVLAMFPARYRLGMSATPDRKDELNKVLKLHLECDRIVIKETKTNSRVYVVGYPGCYSWYANTSPKTGRYISEVCEDGRRNQLLVDCIRWLYENGRKILVIGERIGHLEGLHAMLCLSGVPEDEMVLYTGKENVWGYVKNETPTGDPEGYVKGTEYTPIKLAARERRVDLKKRDELLRTRQVILSTYAVFSKGVDVPDLDAGIDVTPRTNFVQQHGRILRKKKGKKIPIWITLRDFNSKRAEFQFEKRLAEFVKSNAEIYTWQPGSSSIKRKDPAKLMKDARLRQQRLKTVQIVTDAGGNYTPKTRLTAPAF